MCYIGCLLYEHVINRRNNRNEETKEAPSDDNTNAYTAINVNLLENCMCQTNPIENWSNLSRIRKCFEIFTIPVDFILNLFVPKVGNENWNKLLCALQILISPVLILFAFDGKFSFLKN